MAFDSLAPLGRLAPLSPATVPQAESASAGGFAQVLNSVLAGPTQASAAADTAIRDLATGDAQDLHTVSLAVANADLQFRLLLEIRNRLADAFQEVSRIQI